MVGFIAIVPQRPLAEAFGSAGVLQARAKEAEGTVVQPRVTFKKLVVKKPMLSAVVAPPPPSPDPEPPASKPAFKPPAFTSSSKKTTVGKRLKSCTGFEEERASLDDLFGGDGPHPNPMRTPQQDAPRVPSDQAQKQRQQRAEAPDDERIAKKPKQSFGGLLEGRKLSGGGGGIKLAPAPPKPNVTGNFKVDVVGCRFYKKAIQGPRQQGQQALLEREPQNQHDANAIKVVLSPPWGQIGHVPKEMAKRLAPLIDCGRLSVAGFVAEDSAQGSSAQSIALIVEVTGFGPSTDVKKQGADDGPDEHKEVWKWLVDKIKRDSKKINASKTLTIQDMFEKDASPMPSEIPLSSFPRTAPPARAPSWQDMQHEVGGAGGPLHMPCLDQRGHDPRSTVSPSELTTQPSPHQRPPPPTKSKPSHDLPARPGATTFRSAPPATCSARPCTVVDLSVSPPRPAKRPLSNDSHASLDPRKSRSKGGAMPCPGVEGFSIRSLAPFDFSLQITRAPIRRCLLPPAPGVGNMVSYDLCRIFGLSPAEASSMASFAGSTRGAFDAEAEEAESDLEMSLALEIAETQWTPSTETSSRPSCLTWGRQPTFGQAGTDAPGACHQGCGAGSSGEDEHCELMRKARRLYKGSRTRGNMGAEVLGLGEGVQGGLSDDALADSGAFYLPACLPWNSLQVLVRAC